MLVTDPHAALMRKEIEGRISKAMQRLKAREVLVLSMRHGLGEFPCMTLRAIGERIGVTTERVRQMEAKGHRELRKSRLLDGCLQSGAFE